MPHIKAATVHSVGVGVITLAGEVVSRRGEIQFIAEAIIHGQFARDLPAVARVEAVGRHAHGGGIFVLNVLAQGLWRAEQEVTPTVVAGGGRAAIQ